MKMEKIIFVLALPFLLAFNFIVVPAQSVGPTDIGMGKFIVKDRMMGKLTFLKKTNLYD
jgi:hypothetical protein